VLDAYEGGLPSASYLGVLADSAEAAGAPRTTWRPCVAARAGPPASEPPCGEGPGVTSRPFAR
jgi:hypothetical protein